MPSTEHHTRPRRKASGPETITITLPSSGGTAAVLLERKKMKTCRLKVYPEQRVVLSLPRTVSRDWAEKFLRDRSAWIEAKLQLFQKTVGSATPVEIKDGASIKMLGKDMVFSVAACGKDDVYAEGETIHICSRTPDDREKVKSQFEKWWREQARRLLEERVRHWYPVIETYGVGMPKVAVRKMKTLWGSCSVSRRVVTFNFYLLKAPLPYLDYVVLHELVHFLHPNHSKSFYAFLAQYMPDWKERKNMLDRTVAPGP